MAYGLMSPVSKSRNVPLRKAGVPGWVEGRSKTRSRLSIVEDGIAFREGGDSLRRRGLGQIR